MLSFLEEVHRFLNKIIHCISRDIAPANYYKFTLINFIDVLGTELLQLEVVSKKQHHQIC